MLIQSLLDTDLYKFTMMQVVLHHFPGAQVEYRFKCRTPGVDLTPFLPHGPTYEVTLPADIITSHPKVEGAAAPYGLVIVFNIACAGHIEIEPTPVRMRLERRGRLTVLVPEEPIREKWTVERTNEWIEELREERTREILGEIPQDDIDRRD